MKLDSSNYFEREYFRLHPGKARYLDWTIGQLRRQGLRRGTVLDVGCGFGFLLDALLRAGFTAIGIDRSPEATAASCAGSRGRVAVASADADLPVGDGLLDAITMLDVIEHLRDPAAVLAQCARCLRLGGWLMVITLNRESLARLLLGRRWAWYQDPTHLHLLGPASLTRMLQGAGFEVVRRSTVWNFHVAGEGTRFLLPLRRLARMVEWPRFGDSLFFIARRR